MDIYFKFGISKIRITIKEISFKYRATRKDKWQYFSTNGYRLISDKSKKKMKNSIIVEQERILKTQHLDNLSIGIGTISMKWERTGEKTLLTGING